MWAGTAHYVVAPEVRRAAEKASFLIMGVHDDHRRSKRKRQAESQIGMGLFYTPTTALTCAHNLPPAAKGVGKTVVAREAREPGMHPNAHVHIIDVLKHRAYPT